MNTESARNKILVVDDEPDMLELMMIVLTRKGYQSFGATNGADAIIVNDKENPALIILDLRMPGMDGIETLRQIREKDDKVQVIVLTGVGSPDIVKNVADLDVSECLRKPIDHDQLFDAIKAVLAR